MDVLEKIILSLIMSIQIEIFTFFIFGMDIMLFIDNYYC